MMVYLIQSLRGKTLLLCCLLFISHSARANSQLLDNELNLFLEWFTGEFDNNEQVWQQSLDGITEEEKHEHIHHIFLPVSTPNIGKQTFFVKQYQNGDYNNVYRQRLYNFTVDDNEDAIRLAIYRFKDEEKYRATDQDNSLIAGITKDELKNTPGCDVFWTFQTASREDAKKAEGDHFLGQMKDKACFYFSERIQKNIYISDTLKLTSSEIWIGDKAFDEEGNKIFGRDEQHRNRKVRYFKGWASIKESVINPGSDNPDNDIFFSDLRWHNEGSKVPLVTKEGMDSGYTVELAQLTYQNTGVAILKLGLIENKSGKTITYNWASTDTERIGINLRWLQVGLTEEK